jgi:hypothetical protein
MRTILECGEARLALDMEWEPARPGDDARIARCRLQFSVGGWPFDLSFETDSRYLAWFLQGARDMHRELEGSTALSSWDEDCRIQMQVADSGRSTIAVGVSMSRRVARESDMPASTGFPFGHEVRITVGGLFTDQSYLPAFLNDLTRFLAEADEDPE